MNRKPSRQTRKRPNPSPAVPRGTSVAPPVRSRGLPRRIARTLAVLTAVPLLVLAVLRATGVPLGEPGRMVYGYSGLFGERILLRAWPAALAAAVVAAGIGWLGGAGRARRFAAPALALGIAGLVVWAYAAPTLPVGQHLLNLNSPGQDGAFLIESRSAPTAREYLEGFEARVARSPGTLGGTRVISNPPGLTLLAYAMHAVAPPRVDPPGLVERWLVDAFDADLPTAQGLSPVVRFSLLLTAAWGLSAVFAYGLGRVFLSPAAAGAFAVVVTFNPSTVDFAPGKDPAQLLTINAMLWAWLAAWRGRRGWRADALAVAAGAVLVAGTICGLIHLWVAAAVAAATVWAGGPRSVGRPAVFAVIGVGVTLAALRLGLGWNAPHALWAVYRRFGEVQPIIYPNRGLWLVIGLPLFLLFLSPGVATPAWKALRPAHRGPVAGRHPLGRRLLVVTLAVMALTYVVGVTYELPRLWVAFVPLLTLGGMAACPLFRGSPRASRRARGSLVALVLAQIAFTVVHHALLDARQSEQRLTSGRLFSRDALHFRTPVTFVLLSAHQE